MVKESLRQYIKAGWREYGNRYEWHDFATECRLHRTKGGAPSTARNRTSPFSEQKEKALQDAPWFSDKSLRRGCRRTHDRLAFTVHLLCLLRIAQLLVVICEREIKRPTGPFDG